MRKCGNVVVVEKLTCCESSLRGCVVVMQQPIARILRIIPVSMHFSPKDLYVTKHPASAIIPVSMHFSRKDLYVMKHPASAISS
jgi:hypothetical protein